MGKNSKALERRKYKGLSVLWLYGMLVFPLKYGENEVKRGKKLNFKKAESLAK
ncbi:unnamed protein product [marine sediment metagenome]|uniref:Uncharacterized protein n=1 Tax=marine sediment metagenome TaxID=412755 RepID=X1RHC1_9ZZZZ